ncbi:PIG-L family deacetylase [Actinomadura logoneensis]|uniref:PIG-L family deacetylase n=1 Tax=Actinomadura logoneensis TaxID=2293572 RepID=UPI0013144791|nr:PIG-L family deacetylase [Actinomadura logoneensis]
MAGVILPLLLGAMVVRELDARHATGTTRVAGPSAVAFMQVVAHPDDDLYFLNPDLLQSVRSGAPVTTVYVTAGEANGQNVAPGRPAVATDHAGYIAARHAGLRRAYAQMATGNPNAVWTRGVLPTMEGPVESDTLGKRPNVRLVFLNTGNWRGSDGRMRRLMGLWERRVERLRTRPALGSPVGKPTSYTRAELIAQLDELMRRFHPSVIRTLDPAPERGTDQKGFEHRTDHPDHTATALMTREAARRYQKQVTGPVVTEYYRGYYNRHWPANLGPGAFQAKMSFIRTYGWADKGRFPCREPGGCGDLRTGDSGDRNGWPQSTHPRYTGSTRWMQPQADGRLVAFAVVSDRVTRWEQDRPGGGWRPGVPMPDPGFVSDLDVARLPDGRLAVFGLRVLRTAALTRPRYQIMYARQDRPNGPFGDWRDLGNPAGSTMVREHDAGAPVTAVDGAGRIAVFSRNSGQGVSVRYQNADQTFGPWIDLGGRRVQDGLTAGTDASGRIEVFGAAVPAWAEWRWNRQPGTPSLWHWRQPASGRPLEGPGAWTPTEVGATGPLTMVRDGRGRLSLVARQVGGPGTLVFRQRTPDGAWPDRPVSLPGPGGVGPVGAVEPSGAAGGGPLLVGRDASGGVGVSAGGARWQDAPGLFMHAPATVVDGQGGVVTAVLDPLGRLRVTRPYTSSGSGVDTARWQWQTVGVRAPGDS